MFVDGRLEMHKSRRRFADRRINYAHIIMRHDAGLVQRVHLRENIPRAFNFAR